MTDRKDLIFAVLATFSVTVALFGILPTRSSSVNPYDPWLDFDDDGVINMRDIGAAANAFGTYGDPTKDVVVTNFPLDEFGNLKVSVFGGITQEHNYSQKIVVFSTETQMWTDPNNPNDGHYEGGVLLDGDFNFMFDFNPLGTSINVTNICVSLTVSPIAGDMYVQVKSIDLGINDNWSHFDLDREASKEYLTLISFPILEQTQIMSMHEGTNMLQVMVKGILSGNWHYVNAYQITLYVDYECLK